MARVMGLRVGCRGQPFSAPSNRGFTEITSFQHAIENPLSKFTQRQAYCQNRLAILRQMVIHTYIWPRLSKFELTEVPSDNLLEGLWLDIMLLLTYHSSCVCPCPSTLTQLG